MPVGLLNVREDDRAELRTEPGTDRTADLAATIRAELRETILGGTHVRGRSSASKSRCERS